MSFTDASLNERRRRRLPAAAGVTSKGAEVAPVTLEVAARVYPVPILSSVSVSKVATPAAAATVVVPPSVERPGLASIAKVTSPTKPVATLPNASRAWTTTAGAIG